MQKTAKEKLIEKHIDWHEEYTEKTAFLKRQFEDTIGEGSYYRFEGESSEGDRYYCIVGPAQVHKPRAKFFAGVRKLPATYSAGGKYFDSMDRAAAYAEETWGVTRPKTLRPYTSAQLHGISEKVKKWKAVHGEDHEIREKEKEDKNEKESSSVTKTKKESNMKVSFNLSKNAMAERQITRNAPDIWHLQDILDGKVERWKTIAQNPTYKRALHKIVKKTEAIRRKIGHRYGVSSDVVDEMTQQYVGYDATQGLYFYSLGPYFTEDQKIYHFESWAKANGFEGITPEAIQIGLRINLPIIKRKDKNQYDYDTSVVEATVPEDPPTKVATGSVANYANYVRKDGMNRFIGTKQRYQETSESELRDAAMRYIISNMPQFLGILDESDLRMIIGGEKPTSEELPMALETFTEEDMKKDGTEDSDLGEGGDEEGGEIAGAGDGDGAEVEGEEAVAGQVPEWYQSLDLNDPRVKGQRQVAGEGVIIRINSHGIKKILETILSGAPSKTRGQVIAFMVANGVTDESALYDKLMETENIPDDFSLLREMREAEKKYKKEYKEKAMKGGQKSIIRVGLKNLVKEINEMTKGGTVTMEQLLASEREREAGATEAQQNALVVRDEIVSLAMTKLSQDSGYVYDRKSKKGAPLPQRAGAMSVAEIDYAYKNGEKAVIERLYKAVLAIQQRMIKDGDARVAFMMPIAKLDQLKRLKTPIGAQRTETLRTPPVVIKQIQLKASVLRVMSGMLKANPGNPDIIHDPVALAKAVNRSRAGFKIGEEFSATRDAPYWIDILLSDMREAEAKGEVVTVDQLMIKTEQEARDAEVEGRDPIGTETLDECYYRANQHMQGGEAEMIDPETKSLWSYVPFAHVFPRREGAANWSSATLGEFRTKAGKTQPELPDMARLDVELVKPEDQGVAEEVRAEFMRVDVEPEGGEQLDGEDTINLGGDVPPTDGAPEQPLGDDAGVVGDQVAEAPPVDAQPEFPLFEVKPKEEEKKKLPPPLPPKKKEEGPVASSKDKIVLTKTLKNLIVIAKDLDKEGKKTEAEEVHKVIRKYIDQIGKK